MMKVEQPFKFKETSPNWDIVPWFSWEEWEDVYRNIYGNNAKNLRKAYNQICVWKLRANKLAAGIEGTFPLLHALIAQADPHIEESFKNSVLNISIIRFVSIVSKGYDRHRSEERIIPLHGMANIMNLPPFLIELRNVMVHKDEVLGSSETLKLALDAALQWIKLYYWDEEHKKALLIAKKEEKRKIGRLAVQCENVADNNEENDSVCDAVPIQDFNKLRVRLQEYVELFMDKKLFMDRRRFLRKEVIALKRKIGTSYKKSRKDTVKVLVEEFFYSHFIQDLQQYSFKHRKGYQQCDRCRRKCFLNSTHFTVSSEIMNIIQNFNSINLFLKELVSQGKKNSSVCEEWIRALLNTVTYSGDDDDSVCDRHRFIVFKQSQLIKRIKWRNLIYNIFSLGEQWSSSLAFEILDRGLIKLDSQSRKMLKELLDIYLNPEISPENGENDASVEELASVDDVIQRACKASQKDALQVIDIYNSVRKPGVKRKKRSTAYLGVLPHQVNDPYFYQQLILHPSSPSSKKRKQIHTSPEA